ncbi:FkbM family methyltransferase [Bradyrhizobium sp. LHD-71]|uniref:FkbM family methyltransferase n=1 Tax=Bradyrhizobium sp. LHD-71 TaxID=3072141 RepID=UPI00280F5171|nr:FkbM family methyltransferase [Bradyrhizobium sp. LHD-71]MDQ8728740.1 FkbM family methyltransferase [Bradyrhizobium sp. LHD-71]
MREAASEAIANGGMAMSAGPRLAFDRATGAFDGASVREQLAAYAFQAGARLSSAWSYRGFAAGCKAVRSVLPGRDITVVLNEDAQFAFPYGDGNWTLLLDRNYRYEPDIELFLNGIADVDYTLIDCGASYGYWPVLTTSKPYGAHRGIAIEARSRNFARLAHNAKINGSRIKTIRRAIGERPGMARLPAGEDVAVISLDSLIDGSLITALGRYVIRLDLDGAEVQAMRGGQRLLKSDCVLICKERGNDADRAASLHILEQTGLKLFCYDRATGHFEHLRDVAALNRVKQTSNVGYNVLATASAFWESRIRALSGEPVRKH